MTSTAKEGDLCGVLVTFAQWRSCAVCGAAVLYVNPHAGTDGDVECDACRSLRDELARELRRMPLPVRVALHLRSLFATRNDNAAVRS